MSSDKLIAYCSAQAHSSVERAGMLAGVKMRLLHVLDNIQGVIAPSKSDELFIRNIYSMCLDLVLLVHRCST